MVKKILVDSNILIALYCPQDSQHLKAKKIIELLTQDKVEFFIHSLIILEVLTVLKQKTKTEILKKVKQYLFDPNYYILLEEKFLLQPDDFVFRIFEENKNISLVDAKLIELAFLKNLNLLTLDQRLRRTAKKYQINLLPSKN